MPKPVTPSGGRVRFNGFLQQLGYAERVQALRPLRLTRPKAMASAHRLTAFVVAVVAGVWRFAHSELLRRDRVLRAFAGRNRFPGHDTIRRLFPHFWQADVEAF